MQLSVFNWLKFCIYPVGNYRLYNHCGDNSLKDPPVLIPNTEVKLQRAESTCRVTCREDRSLPHSINTVHFERCFLFCLFIMKYFRSAELNESIRKNVRALCRSENGCMWERCRRLKVIIIVRVKGDKEGSTTTQNKSGLNIKNQPISRLTNIYALISRLRKPLFAVLI